MAMALATFKPAQFINRHRGLILPTGAASLILVILIPLPTALMDLLLVANITISALILMTVMYIKSALEFSTFPSLLLSITLYRLVLNTATTRLILTNASQGAEAAGRVIEVFGEFVAGGSLAVGVIIFAIILIIQFVVITKGATRVAEVAARFTLDGMPGKQMAIDADLNAGLIKEDEARRRRDEISREADFYGAMDGASKFVRGDAVAGLIITFVNVIGGMYVGMVELDMPLMETAETFTKLTIGDGLVSQIPAFIVSVAAGMLVTRSAGTTNIGEELLGQMISKPISLGLAAGFLGLLALTPLPKIPLGLMGGACLGLAFIVRRTKTAAAASAKTAKQAAERKPEKVEDLLTVEPMELEVGYGLIRLVDRKQGGDLLDRITNIRRQMALDLGIVVPPIRIRDNIRLQPNQYVMKLRANEIAYGEVMPDQMMAIDSGTVTEPVSGIPTTEPAFGLPAIWIPEDHKHIAEHRNYTVVSASSVLGTHLTEVIRQHAHELLTRQEMNQLLDNLRQKNPKLVEEVVGELLKIGDIQHILKSLLRERVPVRDLEIILETLGDWAQRTKDPDVLNEYVRNALARTLCKQWAGDDNRILCLTLDPRLEDLINAHVDRAERGAVLTLPPQTQNRIVTVISRQIGKVAQTSGDKQPVVLCSPQVRMWIRRMIEPVLPRVPVLAYNEIVRNVEVVSRAMVALDESENL